MISTSYIPLIQSTLLISIFISNCSYQKLSIILKTGKKVYNTRITKSWIVSKYSWKKGLYYSAKILNNHTMKYVCLFSKNVYGKEKSFHEMNPFIMKYTSRSSRMFSGGFGMSLTKFWITHNGDCNSPELLKYKNYVMSITRLMCVHIKSSKFLLFRNYEDPNVLSFCLIEFVRVRVFSHFY